MKTGRLTKDEDMCRQMLQGGSFYEKQIKNDFLLFWELHDEIYRTTHLQIIKQLYVLGKNNFTEISYKEHVDERTLYGYRIKYIDLFLYLVDKHRCLR